MLKRNYFPQSVFTSQKFCSIITTLSLSFFMIFYKAHYSQDYYDHVTCTQFAFIHFPVYCPMARYNICITAGVILILNLGMCQR